MSVSENCELITLVSTGVNVSVSDRVSVKCNNILTCSAQLSNELCAANLY